VRGASTPESATRPSGTALMLGEAAAEGRVLRWQIVF